MPIPQTREELTEQLAAAWEKLDRELQQAGPRVGNRPCVDEWTIKDLLAVRLWWSEQVVDWIEAGLAGDCPETPAPGYRWSETPRLNDEIVRRARRHSFRSVCQKLMDAYQRVVATVDHLNDDQLLKPGQFAWSGSYPLSRWISINTTRQYTTARTLIRRALKE